MRKTKFIATLLAIALCVSLLPISAAASSAAELADTINGITGLAATQSGDTVTVTGSVTDVTATLELAIDAGVEVIWQAEMTGGTTTEPLITLSGSGTFELADGGRLVQTTEGSDAAHALKSADAATINVVGGTIFAVKAAGIHAVGGTVNISGGEVSSENTYAVYGRDIVMSGGEVYSATSNMSYATVRASGTTTVSGGTVRNTGSGNALFSNNGPVVVQGDAVISSMSGTALFHTGNGDLTVGGNVLVMATSGRAIHSTQFPAVVTIKENATVFAYGANLITGDVVVSTGSLTVSDDALVLGWTNPSETEYFKGTQGNIATHNLAANGKVGWVFGGTPSTNGIAYENGANSGFIPLPVTEIVATIAVEPSNLTFKVGESLDWTNDEISFRISNDTFAEEITVSEIMGIITGLPAGVSISYVTHSSSDDTLVHVVLDGTPTTAGSGKITIVGAIPSEHFTNYPDPITPDGEVDFQVEKGDGSPVEVSPSADGTPKPDKIVVTDAELNGKTTQSVEYAISKTDQPPADGWSDAQEFTGLDADTTYYIFARSANNDDYNVGTPCVGVEIKTIAAVYAMELDITTHTFPEARAGYAAQTAVTVTVTNTGNAPTGELALALGDTDFEVTPVTIASLGVGESATFAVVPSSGLSVGNYTDTVTVNGANSLTETVDVSFAVKSASSGGGFWDYDTPTTTTPKTETGGGDGAKTDDGPTTIITDDGTEIEVPGGSTITDNGKVIVGEDGATITYTDGGKGEMPGGFEFQLDPDAPHGFRALTSIFEDVYLGDWYFDDVHGAYFLRLMIGTSLVPPLFSPNMSTTRAMVITVMYRLELVRNGAADYEQLSSFDDVPVDTWYTDAAAWGEENEVIYGVAPNRYAPNRPITRQDLAAILMRYADFAGLELPELYEPPEFVDGDEISPYATEAVEALCRAGVIFGKPGGIFDPKGYATRAELATMLTRFLAFVDVEVLAA